MSIDLATSLETPAPSDFRSTTLRNPEFDFDVAIVGLGYVGLPTALAMHTAGARVLGVDTSERRLAVINGGQADLLESDRARLKLAQSSDDFEITEDASRLSDAESIIICVPTPIDEYFTPDLGILRSACATVVDVAVPGQLIILTSTTYVGCTRDLLLQPLELRGFTVGDDILVAFSPERIDPGNNAFAHEDVPRVIGGATERCLLAGETLLRRYARNVHAVPSPEAAELTKLIENTFRAVNIALANEFSDACEVLSVPVGEVISAAATKPYGFMPFLPGPGVGGHCIPCDPHYLLWQLRKEHISLPIVELAMAEIASRPRRVVERIRSILAGRAKALKDSRVLIVGVAYKPDVADLRESPALEIMNVLRAEGAEVAYHDPYFDSIVTPDGVELIGTRNPGDFDADLVLLHTDHTAADTSWMSRSHTVLDATYRRSDLANRFVL